MEITVPTNSIWRVESTDTLSAPYWQLVDVLTNHAASTSLIRDFGQNGRLGVGQTPTRFYRLVPE
ncbi:MAG: hypothetical protein HY735_09140 [Verrucomicrobia bacterium]|nr:hypothetical protein [Verrucomicrobiota bacterium]